MYRSLIKYRLLALALLLVLHPPTVLSNRCASHACAKPTFQDLSPPQSSLVKPGDEFSFTAAPGTNPRSIKVMVKGHAVQLSTVGKSRIKVKGRLPADLPAGFARINISASSSPSSCVGTGGWLVKVEK